MKTTSTAMQTAIAQEVTTLTTCWVISRIDGTVYGFTEHDSDITTPDGVLCLAATGFSKTNLADKLNSEIPNVQIEGILDAIVITEHDLRARLWDYAKVEVMVVDWANAAPAPTDFIPMMSGNFGAVTQTEFGFMVELRGLADKLTRVAGELISPLCRVDLGSARCGVDLSLYNVYGSVSATDGFRNLTAPQSVFSIPSGGLAPGTPSAGGNQQQVSRAGWSIQSVESENTSGGRNYVASNLLNNDPYTYWSNFTGPPSWVIIDFGATITLNAIQLQNRNNNDDRGSPASFTVEFSSNLTTWSLAGTFRGPRNGTGLVTTYAFASAASGRYMRINIQTRWGDGNVVISKVFGLATFTSTSVGTGNSAASGYYDGGAMHFLSGLNAGLTIEMKQVTQVTGGNVNVQLYLKTPFQITVGDQFVAVPGCDKLRTTCRDKFHNAINFQGEPDVPGNDFLLAFPDMRANHGF